MNIIGTCKDCGWTDSWDKVKRVTSKKNKYEYNINCPDCDRNGVTIIFEKETVNNESD